MNLVSIPAGMETGFFVLGRGALSDLPELLRTAFPGRTPWLIADENTWRAAGAAASDFLRRAGCSVMEPQIFPGIPKLHPDYAVSRQLAGRIRENMVPVAVGSGVLNDLVKCASGIAGVSYCCVATAASVDGYTSSGGAMTVDGTKKTVPCPAPYALLADVEVLENAPPEMMASGYADLLTKVPAGADWRIADILGIEPIDRKVWDMVQRDIRCWVADCRNLEHLFAGLSATGYSMQVYHDSRPASGAEHLFSHVWEMEHLSCNGEEPSHGFKVGIGTIAVVKLMYFIADTPADRARSLARSLLSEEARKTEVEDLLKRGCYGSAVAETAMAKFLSGAAGAERRELIFRCWEKIQRAIREQLFPPEKFTELLRNAGAPTDYREIGLDREQYIHGARTAQLIRKRYTVLDLLYEAGLLDDALKEL